MSWEPAKGLGEVRDELRKAIFDCVFYKIGYKIEGRDKDVDMVEQRACSFIQFGVQSGLMTPQEGNDWLDAVWDKKTLAEVLEKYPSSKESEVKGEG